MTWQDICAKYKDTELMKEFRNHYFDEKGVFLDKEDRKEYDGFVENIKDIWGYLICFAETKKISFEVQNGINYQRRFYGTFIRKHFGSTLAHKSLDTFEQSMIWCADKFFEVAK